jgi:hypothetical protein
VLVAHVLKRRDYSEAARGEGLLAFPAHQQYDSQPGLGEKFECPAAQTPRFRDCFLPCGAQEGNLLSTHTSIDRQVSQLHRKTPKTASYTPQIVQSFPCVSTGKPLARPDLSSSASFSDKHKLGEHRDMIDSAGFDDPYALKPGVFRRLARRYATSASPSLGSALESNAAGEILNLYCGL